MLDHLQALGRDASVASNGGMPGAFDVQRSVMNQVGNHSPRRTAAQWHQIVEAQQASDLSAPKFCEENSISYASFINWKKKLTDKTPKHDERLRTCGAGIC